MISALRAWIQFIQLHEGVAQISKLCQPSSIFKAVCHCILFLTQKDISFSFSSIPLPRIFLRDSRQASQWNGKSRWCDPISSHSLWKICEFKALALAKFTIWIASLRTACSLVANDEKQGCLDVTTVNYYDIRVFCFNPSSKTHTTSHHWQSSISAQSQTIQPV